MAQKIQNNTFIYKYADTEFERIEFSVLAAENNLYVEGWCFEDWLKEIDEDGYEIGICFYDNIPVAVSIINPYNHIGFFVNHEFRRMGIGKELHKLMIENSPKNKEEIFCAKGIDGSGEFFNSLGMIPKW